LSLPACEWKGERFVPGYTDKSREYLRYVVDHEARAAKADNPKLSKIFLQIANEYRTLAGQLDAPWEDDFCGLEAARFECRFEAIGESHVLARIGDEDSGLRVPVLHTISVRHQGSIPPAEDISCLRLGWGEGKRGGRR
jgi:hypothetical protein